MDSPYLRRSEAAEYLGVTPATIDRWVRDGVLARYRLKGVQRSSRFRVADLDELLEAGETDK